MKLFLANLLIFQSQALTNSSSDYVSARMDARLDDFTDIFPDDVECTLSNGNVLNAGKNWGKFTICSIEPSAFVVRIIKILLLLMQRESRIMLILSTVILQKLRNAADKFSFKQKTVKLMLFFLQKTNLEQRLIWSPF